jgi:hypothetical protein
MDDPIGPAAETVRGRSRRTRLWAAGGMLLAAAFGLASRSAPMADWPVIGAYGGDAAWAMAAYAGWRMLLPSVDRLWIAGLAFGLATMVEISQLADWEWLNSIRDQRLGALLLGRGFLWSDLAAYAVGTITAMIIGLRSRSWIEGHRPRS